jgi:hypothetical protein
MLNNQLAACFCSGVVLGLTVISADIQLYGSFYADSYCKLASILYKAIGLSGSSYAGLSLIDCINGLS